MNTLRLYLGYWSVEIESRLIPIMLAHCCPPAWRGLPLISWFAMAEDDVLKRDRALEKRAKRKLFMVESGVIRKRLPPTKLEMFKGKDGIVFNASRFDKHKTFRSRDTEVGLPVFENLDISPVAPVVLVDSEIFQAFMLSTSALGRNRE